MKTFTITLSKGEISATMTAIYSSTDWPDATQWTGDRAAFRLRDGSLPMLKSTIDRLEETVAFQAGQSGATHTIRDDGGEAMRWHDNVILPPSLP